MKPAFILFSNTENVEYKKKILKIYFSLKNAYKVFFVKLSLMPLCEYLKIKWSKFYYIIYYIYSRSQISIHIT